MALFMNIITTFLTLPIRNGHYSGQGELTDDIVRSITGPDEFTFGDFLVYAIVIGVCLYWGIKLIKVFIEIFRR